MTLFEMMKLQEEYGLEISTPIVLHDEDDYGNEFVLSYNGVIVGSELVSVDFVVENIKDEIRRRERGDKYSKLIRIAKERGDDYGDWTMYSDLELCDKTFELDLDKLIYEYEEGYESFFWDDLDWHIDRKAKSFDGWIPNYATKIEHSVYEEKVKELLGKHPIPEVVGFIYALYQDCDINEPEELYLYKIADPLELFNNPSEYWGEYESGDNPLAGR